MSDTNQLDNKEITDLLFKNYLGFPSTNESLAFYQEPISIKYNNYVMGNEVLIEDIPTGANLSFTSITSTVLDNSFGISLGNNDFKSGSFDVELDNSGIILKFKKLKLEHIPNTQAFHKTDGNGNNVLKDSIQFNYNKYTDENGSVQQPYLYTLYDNTGTNELVSSDGSWLFDVKSGIVTFYDLGQLDNSSNLTQNGIYLTFYKYVGKKGVQNLSVDLNNWEDASLGNVDVSGIVDMKSNVIIRGITDMKNNVIIRGNLNTSGYLHIDSNFSIGNSQANGLKSFAHGSYCKANESYSHAEGDETTANGSSSHTEGRYTETTSNGMYGHAEGYGTVAYNSHMHAEGRKNKLTSSYGTGNAVILVVGTGTGTATVNRSQETGIRRDGFVVLSDSTILINPDSTGTCGIGTSSPDTNYALDVSGYINFYGAFRQGDKTSVTSGLYSHTEGRYTRAYGNYSHAEGYYTFANGTFSHAEGYNCTSQYSYAHSEGYQTNSIGSYGHAEGYKTTTYGLYNHAGGKETVTYNDASGMTVFGSYNKHTNYNNPYNSNVNFVIGTGTSDGERRDGIIVHSDSTILINPDGTGTCGIGTSTPSSNYALDVSGSLRGSFLYANGSNTSSPWPTFKIGATSVNSAHLYVVNRTVPIVTNTSISFVYNTHGIRQFGTTNPIVNFIDDGGDIKSNIDADGVYNGDVMSNSVYIPTSQYTWRITNYSHQPDYSNNLHFSYNSKLRGTITSGSGSQSLGWTNYMNFTGQHHNYSPSETVDESYTGFIVSSSGVYRNKFTDGNTKSKQSITINESLPIVVLSTTSNDKKCFGVISDKDDCGDCVEQAHGNFVSIFEVKNEDRRLTINSLGEGAMWVCDINGALENGDYITTSNIPGIGMLQDDDLLHNYTVGKITMDCSFNPATIHQNKLKVDASDNPILDEQTQEFEFELMYDESGNPVMEEEYDMKYIQINGDGYVIYNDEAKTVEHMSVEHDFATLQPNLVGQTYKMAFVGCTYHCG